MPVETITLRKTVAGSELYAKMAEYDTDGNNIADSFAAINGKIPSNASSSNKMAVASDITSINDKIPVGASSSNLLVTTTDLTSAVSGVLPAGRTDGAILTGVSSSLAWVADEYEDNFVIHEPDPPYPTEVIGGKRYRVVTMPDGNVWMAENLDYKFNGCSFNPANWNDGNANCCYPNNSDREYAEHYGLWYNWYATKYLNDHKDSLIPGWHVPSIDELMTLINAVGGYSIAGKKLKSTTGWETGSTGLDTYEFSMLPSGHRYASGSYTIGLSATLRSSTATEHAVCFIAADLVYPDDDPSVGDGGSIRLVKDAT